MTKSIMFRGKRATVLLVLLGALPLLLAGVQSGFVCAFCACEQHNPGEPVHSSANTPRACCAKNHQESVSEGVQLANASCNCTHVLAAVPAGVLVEGTAKNFCSKTEAHPVALRPCGVVQCRLSRLERVRGPDAGLAKSPPIICKMQC